MAAELAVVEWGCIASNWNSAYNCSELILCERAALAIAARNTGRTACCGGAAILVRTLGSLQTGGQAPHSPWLASWQNSPAGQQRFPTSLGLGTRIPGNTLHAIGEWSAGLGDWRRSPRSTAVFAPLQALVTETRVARIPSVAHTVVIAILASLETSWRRGERCHDLSNGFGARESMPAAILAACPVDRRFCAKTWRLHVD